MGYGWPYSEMEDAGAEERDDELEREEHEQARRDRMDDHAPAAAPVAAVGLVDLTAGSPEVVRLREAVVELNASEGALVLELPGADLEAAEALAARVLAAREEFDAAFAAVDAQVHA